MPGSGTRIRGVYYPVCEMVHTNDTELGVEKVVAADFLANYLSIPYQYFRRHITVNKAAIKASLNNYLVTYQLPREMS